MFLIRFQMGPRIKPLVFMHVLTQLMIHLACNNFCVFTFPSVTSVTVLFSLLMQVHGVQASFGHASEQNTIGLGEGIWRIWDFLDFGLFWDSLDFMKFLDLSSIFLCCFIHRFQWIHGFSGNFGNKGFPWFQSISKFHVQNLLGHPVVPTVRMINWLVTQTQEEEEDESFT